MLLEIYRGLVTGIVDDLLEVDNGAIVIKNPVIAFNKMFKEGYMDAIPTDEYNNFLDHVEDLSKLWCDRPVMSLMDIANTIYRHSFIMKEDYKPFLAQFVSELNLWWMTINDIKMLNLKHHGVNVGEVASKAFDKFKTCEDLMEDFYDFALEEGVDVPEEELDDDKLGLNDLQEESAE